MTPYDLNDLLERAQPIIRRAGAYILSEMGQISSGQIEEKSRNSLVSRVDRQAERILVEGLSELLPKASFLTEEDTVVNQESDLQWIIDPLDGTTNFLHGLPHFAVSVALRIDGELALGLIYEPNRDELFCAKTGSGATLNGESIRVSETANMRDSLLSTGFPYYDFAHQQAYLRALATFMKESRGIRRWGAAALDLAWVACGRYDGFFETSLAPWDVAAGILLVQEAGGHVSDFSAGHHALFGKEIVASNGFLQQSMLQIIQAAFESGD